MLPPLLQSVELVSLEYCSKQSSVFEAGLIPLFVVPRSDQPYRVEQGFYQPIYGDHAGQTPDQSGSALESVVAVAWVLLLSFWLAVSPEDETAAERAGPSFDSDLSPSCAAPAVDDFLPA